MNSIKRDSLIRDNWHLNNILHNFIIDYEEELIGQGIDLNEIKEALKLSDHINEVLKNK